jgi:hypothetical protein
MDLRVPPLFLFAFGTWTALLGHSIERPFRTWLLTDMFSVGFMGGSVRREN